jgi:hypothetical protein
MVRTYFTHDLNKPSDVPANQSENYLNTVSDHQSQFWGYNYRITGPYGSRSLGLPQFLDNRHIRVLTFSRLMT